MNYFQGKTKAFTLIELLVVVSIMSLLSSVVFSSVNNARIQARASVKKQQLAIMSRAIEQMYIDRGIIPVNTNSPFWCVIGATTPGGTCLSELVTNGYLGSYPSSPDSQPYYYFYSGGNNVAMVASRLNPQQYGPGSTQWNCSPAGDPADKIYCVEVVLR